MRKMDLGRLIIVPVFTFFLVLIIRRVWVDAGALAPITVPKLLDFGYRIILVCFYCLIILLYLFRGPAFSSSKSLLTNVIAVLATFAPFAIPLLGGVRQESPAVMLAANLLMLTGIAVSLYALSALGRNISIIPQARKLVQSGPYRFVRHPLYAGELIGVFGVVLADVTIPKLAVFLILISAQVYRAMQEERLLSEGFPEYHEYSKKTARFLPGLF